MRKGVIILVLIGEILPIVLSITLNVMPLIFVIRGRTLVFNQKITHIKIGEVTWHLGWYTEFIFCLVGLLQAGYIINHK
tara:strand:+ start:391 stop:627 length:237 start_codon:yes stop_codon:yes gene_type:complete